MEREKKKVKKTRKSKKDEYVEVKWPPPFDRIVLDDGRIISFFTTMRRDELENEDEDLI